MLRVALGVAICLVLASCDGSDSTKVTKTRVAVAPPQTTAATPEALPPSHPPIGGQQSAPQKPPAYKATCPAGWTEKPPSSMRVLNYAITAAGDSPETPGTAQCYVTILGEKSGGITANVNRWAGQMGQSPPDAAAIATLPVLDVLGAKAPMVEIAGHFTAVDKTKTESALLLGLICELPGHAVFVKMTGPQAIVEGQKDNFVAFCESLEPSE